MSSAELGAEVAAGSRRSLAKAITLVEGKRPDDREAARLLMSKLPRKDPPGLRLGVTGSPGVGKSTFLSVLAERLAKAGDRPAVLSFDPSGAAGGSLLADKTRMQNLLAYPDVFIRPSPSHATGGGVGSSAYQATLLCEAAGHSPVLIETVGVGQSDLGILEVADVTLLLAQPGAGDELQAMKRGILDHADILVVTKADGELLGAAERARAELEAAASWFSAGHRPPRPVLSASAVTGSGIDEVLGAIRARFDRMVGDGSLAAVRGQRQRARLDRVLRHRLHERFVHRPEVAQRLGQLQARVERGELSVEQAVLELLEGG